MGKPPATLHRRSTPGTMVAPVWRLCRHSPSRVSRGRSMPARPLGSSMQESDLHAGGGATTTQAWRSTGGGGRAVSRSFCFCDPCGATHRVPDRAWIPPTSRRWTARNCAACARQRTFSNHTEHQECTIRQQWWVVLGIHRPQDDSSVALSGQQAVELNCVWGSHRAFGAAGWRGD